MTISTTPNLALPWPNSDEPVSNGWDAIRDLAVALDTELRTYAVRCTLAANLALIAATWTTPGWVAAENAGGGAFSAGVWTVPKAGLYQVNGTCAWNNGTATTVRYGAFHIGAAETGPRAVTKPDSGMTTADTVAHLMRLAAGDLLTFRVYAGEATPLLAGSGNGIVSVWSAVRVRA